MCNWISALFMGAGKMNNAELPILIILPCAIIAWLSTIFSWTLVVLKVILLLGMFALFITVLIDYIFEVIESKKGIDKVEESYRKGEEDGRK